MNCDCVSLFSILFFRFLLLQRSADLVAHEISARRQAENGTVETGQSASQKILYPAPVVFQEPSSESAVKISGVESVAPKPEEYRFRHHLLWLQFLFAGRG